MSKLAEINPKFAEVFSPLCQPSRYKAAFGGRGSGKSSFFASLLILEHLKQPGLRSVCIREYQRTLRDSSKRLLEDRINAYGDGRPPAGFEILADQIRTPGNGVIVFIGMQNSNAASIQSLEKFGRAWVDEAQVLSARSLELLRPTIRAPGSELWFSWNPRRKNDPVDVLFRGTERPTDAIIVEAQWHDNPWFPAELDRDRQDDLRINPDQYGHVWEGDYISVAAGAYYASALAKARSEHRIGHVVADPLLPLRAFWDIGGTSKQSDACAIWIVQFVGQEIRVLDYYEAVGQPLAVHVQWLMSSGYDPIRCRMYLPHDGVTHDRVYAVTYEGELIRAGYAVDVIKNQGAGAAKQRIEAMRKCFTRLWFNEPKCLAGLEALGWYHEHRDDKRNYGMGPEHDWCFARGTHVLTKSGWREIQDIRVHDQVLTPLGSRVVLRSGIVRETNQWIITNGIKSTLEHRFFTSRGLVMARDVCPSEKFWMREDLGLSILGLSCRILRLGFMEAITLATQRAKKQEQRFCYTGWFIRLCTERYRQAMKSTMLMVTDLITIPKTLRPFLASSIGASINQSIDLSVSAVCAGMNLDATRNSAPDAALSAEKKIMPESSGSDDNEPAYSLMVDRDECYFVRGSDGSAYLVANSSHAADAIGMMAVLADDLTAESNHRPAPRVVRRSTTSWMG